MRRGRAALGLVLACLSGVILGGTGPARTPLLWGAGGLALLIGVGLVLSGLRAPRRSSRAKPAAAPPAQQWVDWQQTGVPRIGTLLMDKYGLITQGELNRALEIQKGSPRRLGEILIDMGVISEHDLEVALRYQRSLQRQAWSQTEGAPLPGVGAPSPRVSNPLR